MTEPVPLRDVLAGHTLRLGLLHFEDSMNPFVKEAMREAFPCRDPSDPAADEADRARYAAVLGRDQKRAANAARMEAIRTVELPAAQATAAAAVAGGMNAKKAAAPGLPLTKELQALEGLAGFPQLADPYQLVGSP